MYSNEVVVREIKIAEFSGATMAFLVSAGVATITQTTLRLAVGFVLLALICSMISTFLGWPTVDKTTITRGIRSVLYRIFGNILILGLFLIMIIGHPLLIWGGILILYLTCYLIGSVLRSINEEY